jgi:hypothetical protein
MSATVFHSIATQFKARYLNPLQFPGSNRSVEDRVSDLENARNGQQPANPRIKIRTRGQGQQAAQPTASPAAREEIKRVGEDHQSDLDNWHAQHSGAASDLLHTFNARMNGIQAQSKPSGGAWDDFHAAFGSKPHSGDPSAREDGWTDHEGRPGWQFKPLGNYTDGRPQHEQKGFSRPKPGSAPAPTASKPQAPVQETFAVPGAATNPQQFARAATPAPKQRTKNAPPAPGAPRAARKSPELALFSIAATRRANTPGYVADQPTTRK